MTQPSSSNPERQAAGRPAQPGREDAEFLSLLGKRVREVRERRGMARRLLAREADVSERYLAQLEAGDGNTSIMLLRRVVLALGVSLADLLSDEQPAEHRLIRRFLESLPRHRLEETVFRLMHEFNTEESWRKQRIALIGLRGAGKSTLGALLASALDVPFVELDHEIEREAGITLSEVFMLYGQSGYRRLERRCLERVIQTNPHAVISVGGGIVSEPDTYRLLLSSCFSVWLKAAPEEHMARVVAQGDFRPMQDNEEAMEDLRRILTAREPLYAKADARIDTSGKNIAQTLIELRQAISPKDRRD